MPKSRALGLGHAVLYAKELVAGEPFAVLFTDDLMAGSPSVMAQMVEKFAHCRKSILAVQDVPREHTNRYGIVSGTLVAEGLVDVSGIFEKPTPVASPSTLAVAGRYILTQSIFQELESIPRGVGGRSSLPMVSLSSRSVRLFSLTGTKALGTTAGANSDFCRRQCT